MKIFSLDFFGSDTQRFYLENRAPLIAVSLCSVIGILAWSGPQFLVPLSLIFCWCWIRSTKRVVAFYGSFAYYLTSSVSGFLGSQTFFQLYQYPIFIAFTVWFSSSFLLALLWTIVWGKTFPKLRITIAMLGMLLPPFGFIGWCSPLVSSGILFPGFMWGGLVLTVLLACLDRNHTKLAGVLVCASILANLSQTTQPTFPGITGINTEFKEGPLYPHFYTVRKISKLMLDRISTKENVKIFLAPEMLVDDWEVDKDYFEEVRNKLDANKQTLIIGGKKFITNNSYTNSLIVLGPNGNDTFLDSRIPVPFTHWKPWAQDGAQPGRLKFSEVVSNKKVSWIICYEQLLFIIPLISASIMPDVMLASSNTWWATSTALPSIQKNTVLSAARLFRVPVVFSVNK